MTRDPSRLWRPLVVTAALSPLAIAVSAYGQQADENQSVSSSAVEAAASGDTSNETEGRKARVEEVVVTGSRIKRDTYSSISPLQIISMEFSKEAGLIDPADILQNSTSSQGQQIDLTFNGFVLDNGPGAATVNLRGLGPQRTLLLLNGRRVAPSGVEGAPAAPNINLIPRNLVQQFDNLLDGASSVYGSDAIAGVINVVTRKDFDGFEIEYFGQSPEEDNGQDNTLAFSWGFNTDRGTFGIGGEIIDRNNFQFKDRPWLNGCESHLEITEDGELRTQDQFYESIGAPSLGDCRLGSLISRTFIGDSPVGSIYYTPGSSNGGWGNWTESGDPYTGLAADGNGDGIGDVNFRNFDLNGNNLDRDFFPKQRNINIMAYGEYTFEGEANFTPYFEVLYNSSETDQFGREGQLFPTVPALNPFNLCNPAAENGVDCGLAFEGYLDNPSIAQGIANEFGLTPAQFRDLGIVNLYPGAIGPVDTLPIVSVRGDRNNFDVDQEQIRGVIGFRTDLPAINWGNVTNWSAEAYISHSRGEGDSVRRGIREDRLNLSLGVFSTTNTPCENNTGAVLNADVAAGCVPVNLYAPSLYQGGSPGDFATQAERDYLFGDRIMNTVYEQTVVNLFATGDLAQLPAGTLSGAIGVEYRYDDLDSRPNDVAGEGLLFGFFSDLGGVGDRTTKEVFAEIDIPLLANLPLAAELTMNLSGRFTDDEYYGNNTTESVKLGWRPTEEMLIRGTWGTAFRAPNLRELFLGGSTGFVDVGDPCYIPEAALDQLTGGYNPENDQREPQIFGNCAAQGVDATLANNNGFNTFSVEVAQGGSLELDPETSESWTFGFAYDQPFTNDFDLRFGMTYYSIKIDNTVIAPSAGFIVADCLLDESGTGQSTFCSRITRDLSDPTDPRITGIGLGFINRDRERARGIDYNMTFEDQFSVGKTPVDFSFDITANRILERSTLFTNEDGSIDSEDFAGEFGFPEYNAIVTARFEWERWGAQWQMQYLSSVAQDRDEVDPFDNIEGASDTCGLNGETVLCRDYAEADSYQIHTVSFNYDADDWRVGFGVRNVFGEEPPRVDGTEVTSFNNVPLGVGYGAAIIGRQYFLNASYRFGGSN